MIRISWYLPRTEFLGPGKRFVLWVQGCERRCRGCIAVGLQDPAGGTPMEIDALCAEILRTPDIEGVTVSGGEPFLQADALGALLHRVRAARPELGTIVYTGCTYEALREDPDAAPLLAETDLLIDGEYIASLDDGRAMRGSSNQRLLYLTDRYRGVPMPEHRKTELRVEGGSMRLIGIPSEASRQMLRLMQEETP